MNEIQLLKPAVSKVPVGQVAGQPETVAFPPAALSTFAFTKTGAHGVLSLNNPLRFQGITNKDRSVELRGSVPLNAKSVAQIQRALIMQGIGKGTDPSSIKLYLGPTDADTYRYQDMAALADTMLLASRPVDVIIKSGVNADLMKAVVSATGKIFMLPGASMGIGPIETKMPYAKNKPFQVRRNMFNDYVKDLESLIMRKTGLKDRVKIHQDLDALTEFNAMEALAYGPKGLIDGILIGHDKVITRADLDAFHHQKGWGAAKAEAFNKNYINVYKLPKRQLKDFAPESIPGGSYSNYKSLEPPKKDEPAEEKKLEANAGVAPKAEDKGTAEAKKMKYFIADKSFDALPVNIRASKEKSPTRAMVKDLPPLANGILDDDMIYFNDAFRDETADQIAGALLALDDKKTEQKISSHIKIIENSPGGSVWSGQELRSTIKGLSHKVDVIVQGMGASCGSWLLCSATGNRFATPNARVMIHEAANSIPESKSGDEINRLADGLHQATMDYIAIVADATGRKFNEVKKDFDNDVWFNPLEAIMYGDKGLLDGILVGHDKVITRQDVEGYLLKQLGTSRKVSEYLARKMEEKRDPLLAMDWKPEKHDETDPFDNPLMVIHALAENSAKKLTDIPRFKHSAPPVAKPDRNIDFFNVVYEEEKKKE